MIKITDLTNRVAKLSGNIVNQIESSYGEKDTGVAGSRVYSST